MKAALLASACAAAFATAAPAYAQTSDAHDQGEPAASGEARTAQQQPTRDGEIIVTATRRSERLQDVPLSVTAFTQEELNDLGIVGYEGIAQNTPGIVVNRPTQNFNNFTARGINTGPLPLPITPHRRQQIEAFNAWFPAWLEKL